MLGFAVAVAAIFFAIIIPLIVVVKYYRPSQYSLLANIAWVIIAIITWPLIPLILATKRKAKYLLVAFYISFLVMAIGAWYWSVLNVQKVIQIQQYLNQHH